jgi:hypothetical protein
VPPAVASEAIVAQSGLVTRPRLREHGLYRPWHARTATLITAEIVH